MGFMMDLLSSSMLVISWMNGGYTSAKSVIKSTITEVAFMNILLKGNICPNCLNGLNSDNVHDSFIFTDKGEIICNDCSMVVADDCISTFADFQYSYESNLLFEKVKAIRES